jgi:hypothetical protein
LGRLERCQQLSAYSYPDSLERFAKVGNETRRIVIPFIQQQPGDRPPAARDPFADEGGLIKTGRGGASRFDGVNWTARTRADCLAGDKVRSIFQDSHGNLWFGSEYDGVARFDCKNWQVLNYGDGLSGLDVKYMLETPDGDMWFGTENSIIRISVAA